MSGHKRSDAVFGIEVRSNGSRLVCGYWLGGHDSWVRTLPAAAGITTVW